jgi:hypothetical protein
MQSTTYEAALSAAFQVVKINCEIELLSVGEIAKASEQRIRDLR